MWGATHDADLKVHAHVVLMWNVDVHVNADADVSVKPRFLRHDALEYLNVENAF